MVGNVVVVLVAWRCCSSLVAVVSSCMKQEVQCPATDRVAAPVFGAIRDGSGVRLMTAVLVILLGDAVLYWQQS